jgi:hypothetical protein
MRPGIDQAEILSLTMPCLLNRLPGLLSGTYVGFSRHFVLSLTLKRQAVQAARLFSETVSSLARKVSMSSMGELCCASPRCEGTRLGGL